MAAENHVDEEKNALKNHMGDSTAMEDTSAVMGNDSTVKFMNGGDKTSSLDVAVRDGRSDNDEFQGLTKEELIKYASDPFWKKVRIILMVVFVVTWLCMLAAAIAIIVVAPKCPPRPELDWWQKSIIYHIHPSSFFDTNGNGYGDINGIHEKIAYLKDNVHADVICVGPMNMSPNFGYAYNINNFNMMCPGHFGSLTDFENLLIAMHKKDMKLLLDFIPNHTSLRHKWFRNSSKPLSVESSRRDFYIWHEGRTDATGQRLPPNDWRNVFGESAWTLHPDRNQFYYHAFTKDEPDLNLTNPAVVAELDQSLKLWLQRGVSGFRLYGVQYLVESANLTDPDVQDSGRRPTMFQPQSLELVAHWRELLNNYSHNDGRSKSRYYPRLLIAEVDGFPNETVKFMKYGDQDAAQIATNVVLTKIKKPCDATCVYGLIKDWTAVANHGEFWSNWQLGNVDTSRVVTRMNDTHYTNALNMLLLTLPGTPIVYYGEEIGMSDATMNSADCDVTSIVNNRCRFVNRSPMQWSDEPFAGFTTGNTTLYPVNSNYHIVNVETQQAHGSGISPLSVFSSVAKLRKEPSFQWGDFQSAVSGNVLFYTRQAEGFNGFLVAVNLGPNPSTVGFTGNANRLSLANIPVKGTVVATTGHFIGSGRAEAFKNGTSVPLNNVHLGVGEGVIFTWPPEAITA